MHRANIAHKECGWKDGDRGGLAEWELILRKKKVKVCLTSTGLLMEGVMTHLILLNVLANVVLGSGFAYPQRSLARPMCRRIPMKLSLRTFFLCASLACAGQVWANTLPDSCGDDKVKFDVKTEKNQAAPAGPAEGRRRLCLSKTRTK